MALLFDGRFRAFDSSGNPLSGATLTIYDAGTSNATSIFRDAALGTPATNPTTGADVSDAGGWFPQFFAAEGSSVDITLKNAAGTTVKTYEDVPFLGADTGAFQRTLPGGTRFKISDSGGVVLMQVGDASPDNTGGTLTVEGWDGTQGDTITLDFATINTTGRLKENSKKIPGVIYTDATTVSAATAATIDLTEDPDGVTQWSIEIWGYSTSLAGALLVQASFDGGATFKSGASDYVAFREENDSTGGVSSNLVTSTSAQLTGSIIGASNRPMTGRLFITTPDSGNDATTIRSEVEAIAAGPTYRFCRAIAWTATGYGRATHIKLTPGGGGTITLKYRVIPQRGSGET